MDDFVDVYAKSDGRKYRKPRHYLDNPRLMAPFRLTPKARGGSQQDPVDTGPVVAVTPDADTNTDTPAAGDKE